MPTILGNYPNLERKPTGLYSLDWCLGSRGNFGAPLRSIYEIYGYPNSGKSTLCYYLAGKLTPSDSVVVCDFENLDREYLDRASGASGFNGTIQLCDVVDEKGKPKSHESMLTQMSIGLENSYGSAVLDSVGAIQPKAEKEGDYGEAFMGKRAKLVAQVAREVSGILREAEDPKTAFVINHVHSIIGGRGHSTAGGEVLKFMAAVRIMIWSKEVFTTSDEGLPIGFYVEGKTEKLRFGARGKTFGYYIVPGFGVHTGASAMFDCFTYGLASRESTVKLDGKSMGYLNKDLLVYASEGKQRKFDPFIEALQKYQETTLKWEDERKEEENVDRDTSDRPRRKGKVGQSVAGE